MAYSPQPHSGAPSHLSQAPFNQRYRPSRLSPSPPQQIVNKRDKKRMAMNGRLTEISNNFTENRDTIYRERVKSLHNDINYITKPSVFDTKLLEETGCDQPEELNLSAAASTQGSVRNGGIGYPTMLPGKHANDFINEVNDAMEERDAALVGVTYNFNFAIEQLQKDYIYSISVAEEEHKRLLEICRQRLIANIQAKKASLQKDKEKLDIADTNALLYHPNQFSINNTGSPGGPLSNRKTRHTRHRLDVEEVDAANPVNGKRKRKAPSDGDNGSPQREIEIRNGHQGFGPQQEDQQATAPICSVEKLFTDKELNANLQAASLDVLADQQAARRRKLDEDISALATADPSEPEDNDDAEGDFGGDGSNDDALLEAPAMERNATSQSYHATRSTRNTNLINGASHENLGELAGRQAAAEMLGTGIFQKERKKDDDTMRAPPLSDAEIDHDFALMAKAMRAEDERRPSEASLLEDVAGERPEYTRWPNMDAHDGTDASGNGSHDW